MTTETSLRELLARQTMAAASELTVDEGGGAVRCLACGHRCLLREGKAGICQVRFNLETAVEVAA